MTERATSLISAETLAPVGEAILSAIPVILAVGLPIFGLVMGIRYIPKLIKMFSK